MKILHYALGFPPYRSGGLTKFCIDIMEQQVKEGHRVAMLWPGKIGVCLKKVNIVQQITLCGMESFEIYNPLPISYDEGIAKVDKFMKKGNRRVYDLFLDKYKPDVIHLHTLMGLHKEFIDSAKDRDIHMVFSVHDFFSICPKVTMFRNGFVCAEVETCKNCSECNNTALSLYKIILLQSRIYQKIKNSYFVKILRKNHRDKYLSGKSTKKSGKKNKSATDEDYIRLRKFYGEIILNMSVIHYNSSVTRKIFESFFAISKSKVIGITHGNIADNRKIRKYTNSLRITYLGPQGEAKGFFY